jgi:CHAT domain-containing protein
MLAVIQPHTPNQSDLPFTKYELEKIKSHVPSEHLVERGTLESPSSVESVMLHLSDISIAHFACHGEQNPSKPLESALLLTDGSLKISQIMEKTLQKASLAFLSACQTATGDGNFADEAIHIAATMLFSGFRGVVGTMW